MTRKPVTLREIAQRLGVHESTVSRALSQRTRHLVAGDVAERIAATARELGYRPNAMAASLRTRRSHTVGVVIPDITNPIFPPIIRGIEDTLYAEGLTAILVNTGDDPAREVQILANLHARQVEGLILGTARETPGESTGDGDPDIPVVLVNRAGSGGNLSWVVNDDASGIRQAIDHLSGLGHRQIGLLSGPLDVSTGRTRRAAFEDAMREAGLDAGAVQDCAAYAITEGRRACDALLDTRPELTALVTANDLLALGAYEALEARGLSCPGDVSVTGFNDMPLVGRLSPPLTTIHVALYEMGAQAAAILLERISDPAAPARRITLPCTLEVRGSTATPRSG